MNKYLLSIILMLLIGLNLKGQVATSYIFTQTQEVWEPISDGTVIWSGTFNNNPAVEVQVPAFVFDGSSYTNIFISENGFITFGGAPSDNNTTPISHADTYNGAISAFGANLHQALTGNPEVSYKQIENLFIIQWQDVRRYFVGGEIISFQVRLDLTGNTIKLVYGGDIAPGQNSLYPQVGLRGPDNQIGLNVNNRTIAIAGGNWINSTPGTANNSTMFFRNSAPETVPSPGLTFTWVPGVYIPCYTPLNIAGTNFDIHSANFSWTAPSPEPPEGYEWEVRTEGLPGSGSFGLINSGTIAQGEVTVTVDGLLSATEYNFYIRSHCGVDNYSGWSNALHFVTACIPVTEMPYEHGFESIAFPPPCWSNVQVSGAGLWNAVENGSHPTILPYEGTKMARFYCFNYDAGISAALVSPELNLEVGVYQGKFRMYRDDGYLTNADKVEIYVNNAPNPDGGILLGTVHRSIGMTPIVSENGWYLYEFDFEIIDNNSVYFMLVGVSDYGNNIFIDQFSVVMQEFPSLELYPLHHDFGEISTITFSDPFLFNILNTGFGSITIDSVVIAGSNSESYLFTEPLSFPLILEEDESLSIWIVFNPESAGLYQAQLEVYTNIGNYIATLIGTGYEEPIMIPPFNENWDFASYNTNSWRFDNYVLNWQMRTGSGSPPPTARFHWSPMQLNYSSSLISAPISLESTGNHSLAVDLRMQDYDYQGTEFLKVFILEGKSWIELASFTNSGDFAWTTHTFNLDTLEGNYTRIRFEASGSNSENINFWEMDNIIFNGQPLFSFELVPQVADFGEIMTGFVSEPITFTYKNTGLDDIEVTSSLINGSQASSFIIIDENTYPITLAQGEFVQLSVEFAPLEAGTANAQLRASTQIGDFEAILSGIGFDEYIGVIPFTEDWATASFSTQMWTFDQPQTNWRIQTNSGNPAPVARFNFSPIATDYSYSMISPRIQVSGSDQSLVLSFDLKLADYNIGGTEWLKVYILNSELWQEVGAVSNNGNTGWITRQYNVTNYVQEETRIRFEATGVSSGFITNWEIDNIQLNFADWPEILVTPTALIQEITDEGTAVQEFYISNEGTGVLSYNADIIYDEPAFGTSWLQISPSTGNVYTNNTQTVQALFDTEGLQAGNEYSANILIASNDQSQPEVEVHVVLSVILAQKELRVYKTKVFPVPANEMLYCSGLEDVKFIQIINHLGQNVYEKEHYGDDAIQINLTGFGSGAYLLRLITTSNIQINHQLLINK
ncbi:MAG: choice-of-anchor D domain-containing protein [Bacteroidales bacterium]|nr:choice-of-anchor D domain-containing protein [Bacteroidales bacterium]